MQPVTVSVLTTIDGRYEDERHDIASFFEHQHPQYAGSDDFDHHNRAFIEASDVLLIAGRDSLLSGAAYWAGIRDDLDATEVRRAYARRFFDIDKVVVSDRATAADAEGVPNTRVVPIVRARDAVAQLKSQPGRGIAVVAARVLWHELLRAGLVDEIRQAIFPLIGGAGVPLFDERPPVALRLLGTETWDASGIVLIRWAVDPAP